MANSTFEKQNPVTYVLNGKISGMVFDTLELEMGVSQIKKVVVKNKGELIMEFPEKSIHFREGDTIKLTIDTTFEADRYQTRLRPFNSVQEFEGGINKPPPLSSHITGGGGSGEDSWDCLEGQFF